MLPSFMDQPFTRKRFPTVLDHGNETIDYSATPSEATFTGSIQPGTGTEDTINRNGAEVVKTIWAVPEADVRHDDIITIKGKDYFVNGEPEDWDTGIMDHLVIHLSRWEG